MTNDDDPQINGHYSKIFPWFTVPLIRNYNLFLESGKLATMESWPATSKNLTSNFRFGLSRFHYEQVARIFSPPPLPPRTINELQLECKFLPRSSFLLFRLSRNRLDSLFTRRTWHRSNFLPAEHGTTMTHRYHVNRTNGMGGDRMGFSNFHGSTIDPTRYLPPMRFSIIETSMMKRYPRFVSLFRSNESKICQTFYPENLHAITY